MNKFELPYADLDFPFNVVLGNHDYGEPVDRHHSTKLPGRVLRTL